MDGTEQALVAEKSRKIPWDVLRIVIAGLLFVAAVAKMINIVTILQGNGLLNSRPLLLVVIAFEGAAATFLLIGDRLWAWRLCIATFTVFVIAAGYAVAAGLDCNCIAQSINPKHVLLIDVTVVAMAIWFRPAKVIASISSRMFINACVCAVAGAVLTGAAVLREQSVDQADPLEFLIADMMVDQVWPLDSGFHPQLGVAAEWKMDGDYCTTRL